MTSTEERTVAEPTRKLIAWVVLSWTASPPARRGWPGWAPRARAGDDLPRGHLAGVSTA